MKKNRIAYLATSAALGAMTPAERSRGRYMRAPDGHGDGRTGTGGTGGDSGGTGGQMDIPTTVESLDAVPQVLRPFYIEKDGKFQLDDINALRQTVGHIKNDNQQVKGKLSKYKQVEDLGLTPEQIIEMHQEAQTRQQQQAEQKGDWEALKQQMADNHTAELGKYKDREGKLLGTINKLLVDDAARAALADPDVAGNPTLLLPLIRDRVKVTETDSGFALEVLRADGVPMLNSQNQPAGLKDLFLEMKGQSEYAGAFKGSGQSGGGAPTGSGGNGSGAPGSMSRSKMNNAQKAAYIREHGQDKYFALPA